MQEIYSIGTVEPASTSTPFFDRKSSIYCDDLQWIVYTAFIGWVDGALLLLISHRLLWRSHYSSVLTIFSATSLSPFLLNSNDVWCFNYWTRPGTQHRSEVTNVRSNAARSSLERSHWLSLSWADSSLLCSLSRNCDTRRTSSAIVLDAATSSTIWPLDFRYYSCSTPCCLPVGLSRLYYYYGWPHLWSLKRSSARCSLHLRPCSKCSNICYFIDTTVDCFIARYFLDSAKILRRITSVGTGHYRSFRQKSWPAAVYCLPQCWYFGYAPRQCPSSSVSAFAPWHCLHSGIRLQCRLTHTG